MSKLEIIQIISSIIIILVVMITNVIIKKESKKIRKYIPEVRKVSDGVLKDLKIASEVGEKIFPQSNTNIIINELINILTIAINDIDKETINSNDMDKIIIQAHKNITSEFNKKLDNKIPMG